LTLEVIREIVWADRTLSPKYHTEFRLNLTVEKITDKIFVTQ